MPPSEAMLDLARALGRLIAEQTQLNTGREPLGAGPPGGASARYVTVNKYADMSGYTAKAIRHKIDQGVWMENRQFRRAPDGRVLIDVEGVEKWVVDRRR